PNMSVTFDQVEGLAKRVYDKTVHNLLPSSSVITRRSSWDEGTRNIGESYQVSVILRPPNGFTHAGSTGASRTALKPGRPMVVKQASVVPFEIDLREPVIWMVLSRLMQQGEGAVSGFFGELQKAMKVSAANRLEVNILKGQR